MNKNQRKEKVVLGVTCLTLFLLMFTPRKTQNCQPIREVNRTSYSYFKTNIEKQEIQTQEIETQQETIQEEVPQETQEVVNFTDYDAPTNYFKSYMSYRMTTDTTSKQYDILYNYAYSGNYGIMMVEDRYCVAMGLGFNIEVGDYVDLFLENGNIIPCIISEVKSNSHTDGNRMTTIANGCISEFVIDSSDKLPYNVGDKYVGSGNISHCCEEWDSSIDYVRVYDKNFLKEVK